MTVCKDFQCEKQGSCLYYGMADSLGAVTCCIKSCDICRIRQTCSKYKADLIIRKVKESRQKSRLKIKKQERETGLEPAASTLARSRSTN